MRVNGLAELGKLLKSAPATAAPQQRAAQSVKPEPTDAAGVIRLTREIRVECWRVIGQVAKAAKRNELLPVLLRARERGQTDAGDVAEHLLFEHNSRRVIAQRLLQIGQQYGLLEQVDRQYRLTESGSTALDTKQIYIPEQGTWTVWASKDPLLGATILRVEPWRESSAYDEVWGEERDKAPKRRFEKLPRWVRDAVGVITTPLVGGAPLRIEQLEAEGEVAEAETTLRATWDVTDARLRIGGSLGGTPVNAAVDAPEMAADAVWMQLMQVEGLWPRWDDSVAALRIGFDETIADERESLVRGVSFKRPDIESLGIFDATTVEGIALRARSAQDATRWADWRLRERVRDYATTEHFCTWAAEAVKPFAEFDPPTPTRQELAEAAWRDRTDRPTPGTWHLVAAEDWSL
ncbi:hypothetical protein LHU53_18720 [Rhodoferax sp. U2-2l]|uniref:hypothetical protein n=1 Tax=Rhodoferax sp. U2-2l TaxID=2884000 RepID=UPI001D09C54C|nr:hypothetical protein [Rhodoferax sp. U2-2l]MCB8748928.1 hypothetical protein [Rhodoferax sp. U2-2l]